MNKVGLGKLHCNIIIEIDCAIILESFKENSCDRSEVCLIAKKFKLLTPLYRQIVITKTRRICNKVAHGLSQLSRSVLYGGLLQGARPTCVLYGGLLQGARPTCMLKAAL
jgi:hypothetical protein